MSLKPSEKRAKAKGDAGEKAISRHLQAFFSNGRIFENVLFASKQFSAQIDHLVVSEKAVYVFESKNLHGLIFGSDDQREWVALSGNRTKRFYNPLWQNERHRQIVQDLLWCVAPSYPVISVVVFSHRTSLCLPQVLLDREPIVTLAQLEPFLEAQERKLPSQKTADFQTVCKAIERSKTMLTNESFSQHIAFAKNAKKTNRKRCSFHVN